VCRFNSCPRHCSKHLPFKPLTQKDKEHGFLVLLAFYDFNRAFWGFNRALGYTPMGYRLYPLGVCTILSQQKFKPFGIFCHFQCFLGVPLAPCENIGMGVGL